MSKYRDRWDNTYSREFHSRVGWDNIEISPILCHLRKEEDGTYSRIHVATGGKLPLDNSLNRYPEQKIAKREWWLKQQQSNH